MSSEERTIDHRGTSSRRRHKHFSPKEKSDAVLRLLRGEDVDTVAAEIGASASRLVRWRDRYQAAGLEALEKKVESKTLYDRIAASTRQLAPWLGLLFVLLVTILLLVRFLNRDPVE